MKGYTIGGDVVISSCDSSPAVGVAVQAEISGAANVVLTAYTDMKGQYRFTGVPPASRVAVRLSGGDRQPTIVATPGQIKEGYNGILMWGRTARDSGNCFANWRDTHTIITGNVYDDRDEPVDKALITAKVLGGGKFIFNGSDTMTIYAHGGRYALNGAPIGSTVRISAAKAGLATRWQTMVPVINRQDNPALNILDFGRRSGPATALPDKPEVVVVSPAFGATGVDPAASFRLTFSEPVVREDVERAFAIYAVGPRSAPAGMDLGPADAAERFELSPGQWLPVEYDPDRDTGLAATGTRDMVRRSEGALFGSIAFSTLWEKDDTVVTFTLKSPHRLLTVPSGTRPPRYALSFQNAVLHDRQGNGRDDGWFRLEGETHSRVGIPFEVAPSAGP